MSNNNIYFLIKKSIFLLKSKLNNTIYLLIFSIFITSILDIFSLAVIFPIAKNIEQIINYKIDYGFFHLSKNITLTIFILILLVFFILKNIISINLIKYQLNCLFKTYTTISLDSVNKLLSLEYEIFSSKDESFHIKKIDHNIEYVVYYAFIPLLNLITDITILFFALIFIFYLKPFLALSIVAYLSIFIICYFIFLKNKITYNGGKIKNEITENLKFLSEIVSLFKYIKIFKMSSFFILRYSEVKKKLENSLSKNQLYANIPKAAIEVIFLIGLCVLFIFLYKIENEKNVFYALILLIGSITIRILPIVNRIIYSTQSIYNSASFINELYNDTENVSTTKHNFEIFDFQIIEFQNISFAYNNPILQNISLILNRNQIVAIVGESGSGKTTFINLLLGLLTPASGNILIDNNIKSPIEYDYSFVSYLDQNYRLIDDTIENNILFGEKLIDIEKMNQIKNLSFLQDLSDKFNEKIGDNGERLSGGQRQRVGIARALFKDKPLIIFDEPTSGLDKSNEEFFLKYLKIISKNKLIILISHSQAVIRIADSVFEIKAGQLSKLK
jgi:ABC-type multidrug transport system fused ATPase/permease subunit